MNYVCRLRRSLIGKLPNCFQQRHREWTRYAYLSDFECGLNTVLWALLWVGILFAVAQHVALANIPEVIPAGARWGYLGFNLAIAYVGAFVFYLLVVRVPLRRDRNAIYRHLAPSLNRVVGEARNLIDALNRAAGFDATGRENSLVNIEEVCRILTPGMRVGMRIPTASGALENATLVYEIDYFMRRARQVNHEILDLSTYLDVEVISLITSIENHGYFKIFEPFNSYFERGLLKPDHNMSFIARDVFDYLQIVDKLDDYIHERLPTTFRPPSYLVSGSNRDSDAVPLRRYVVPTPVETDTTE